MYRRRLYTVRQQRHETGAVFTQRFSNAAVQWPGLMDAEMREVYITALLPDLAVSVETRYDPYSEDMDFSSIVKIATRMDHFRIPSQPSAVNRGAAAPSGSDGLHRAAQRMPHQVERSVVQQARAAANPGYARAEGSRPQPRQHPRAQSRGRAAYGGRGGPAGGQLFPSTQVHKKWNDSV